MQVNKTAKTLDNFIILCYSFYIEDEKESVWDFTLLLFVELALLSRPCPREGYLGSRSAMTQSVGCSLRKQTRPIPMAVYSL